MAYDTFDSFIIGGLIFLGAAMISSRISGAIDRQNELLKKRNEITKSTVICPPCREAGQSIRYAYFEQRAGDERPDLVLRDFDGNEQVWQAYTTKNGTTDYRLVFMDD